MEKIYGNQYLLDTLSAMVLSGRAAHTVLFYGEKGSGRKLMARYYTALLLCEAPVDGRPCGKCNACVNGEKNLHPDIIYAETSGKLGGYSVETARSICSDAFIKPNNSSGRKIYIFRDCHNMDVRTQNTLLKIIEEPPDYAHFIFTCESKSDFLPTIISRCVCFGTSLCTEEDSRAALAERGFAPAQIDDAVSCFHGNIGRCIDYLSNEKLRQTVDLTKRATDSIIKRDEYTLNVTLFGLGRERSDVRDTLIMLDMLVRDAAVLNKDKNARTIGCWREGAEALASMITAGQSERIHQYIENAWSTIECNVSIPLALSALCGEIISCL
ncbi:MAG: DNA polymerase III subunit delta' [Ruminococcus sp.]|nr:DNA polymerase III subunit delta' [Ruminococcus sp.]